MGFELRYQALPPDPGLIELARQDVECGESLQFVTFWFTGNPDLSGPGEPNPVRDACRRLVAARPDLRTRNCYLDRRWDQLHYLLSATRRDEPPTPSDHAIDRAFTTGELIADHVRATQGVPIRWLPPAAVLDVAAVVENLDRDALARHYDPARMEAAGVYKFWADRANEAEWHGIAETFESFRRFFLDAAAAGDAAIACLD